MAYDSTYRRRRRTKRPSKHSIALEPIPSLVGVQLHQRLRASILRYRYKGTSSNRTNGSPATAVLPTCFQSILLAGISPTYCFDKGEHLHGGLYIMLLFRKHRKAFVSISITQYLRRNLTISSSNKVLYGAKDPLPSLAYSTMGNRTEILALHNLVYALPIALRHYQKSYIDDRPEA